MEEKKKELEFIAPEVKVVSISSQRMLCLSVEIEQYKVYTFEEASQASGN